MLTRSSVLALLCLLLLPGAVTVLSPGAAMAQPGYSEIPDHKVEITGIYGYRWTFSRSFYYENGYGDADIADSGFWGISLGFVARPLSVLELTYNRQQSELTFKQGISKETLAYVNVDYWQIGGTQEVPRGKLSGFGSLSLGGTRFSDQNSSLDAWQFSVIFGIGAKAYLHKNIGLRVQGRLPFTFLSGSFGVGCGSGGCGSYIGGTGITALDVSGGLFLMFGD